MLGLRGAVLLGKTIKSGIACFHLVGNDIPVLLSMVKVILIHWWNMMIYLWVVAAVGSGIFQVFSKSNLEIFFNDKKNSGIFSFHFAQAYSVHFELSLFSELWKWNWKDGKMTRELDCPRLKIYFSSPSQKKGREKPFWSNLAV